MMQMNGQKILVIRDTRLLISKPLFCYAHHPFLSQSFQISAYAVFATSLW